MIKKRKLNALNCECGREISIRALRRHFKGTTPHSNFWVEYCTNLINKQKKFRWAWLISDGIDAIRDVNWLSKILNGIVLLEDLTFKSPRPVGTMTPNGAKKISKERCGINNPSVKNKPIYDINNLSKFAKFYYYSNLENPKKYPELLKNMSINFPNWGFSLIGKWEHNVKSTRGYSRINLMLSLLLNLNVEEIIEERRKDRGKLIKIGQKKSNKFQNIINAGKKSLRGHVTMPHLILYNMILSVDPNAIKEKQLDFNKTWKSYDIFSPKLNILIEMHGNVWHDWHKCKKNMLPLVMNNVRNDVIKLILAEKNGYKLMTFWDDSVDKWQTQIEELYGQKSKSYEQALREEIDKKNKK